MNRIIKLLFFGFLFFFCLISCTDDKSLISADNKEDSAIRSIMVSLASRSNNDGDDPSLEIDEEGEEPDELNPQNFIPYSLTFDSSSRIFVSQQTEKVPPFYNDEDIYPYNYFESIIEPNWEKGYNFAPQQDDALEWFKIGERGSYRGSFALYALYFPLSDVIRQKNEDNMITYSVMEDQSIEDEDGIPINLIKSDILGAYHSTPTLFTRLRFRLFHLMTYLRIRLYVPIWDPSSKTGFTGDDALLQASLNNVTPDFAIEWKAKRSSDTEGPAVSALKGEDHIIMYEHKIPKDRARETLKIKYTDYIPKDYFEQPLKGDYDDVKVYDFSVIIPMQKGIPDPNDEEKEISFTSTDFLTFILQNPSGGNVSYNFNQNYSANSTSSNLMLSQGKFQLLELYVPRVGNQVIYINASINPWNHRATSFPLNPSDTGD